MTLGCGAMAGNITSDNVGPQHLINIKRLAYVVRTPEEAFEMPLDSTGAGRPLPAPSAPIDRADRSVGGGTIPGTRGVAIGGCAVRWRAPAAAPVAAAFRMSRRRWWIASCRPRCGRSGRPPTCGEEPS